MFLTVTSHWMTDNKTSCEQGQILISLKFHRWKRQQRYEKHFSIFSSVTWVYCSIKRGSVLRGFLKKIYVNFAETVCIKGRLHLQFSLRFNLSAIFFFWWMWTSGWAMNVQMRVYILRTFITHLLVHIHQMKKIALEMDYLHYRLNFDLNKSRQNFDHSLKEHHKISNISKFRCEML
jgi:hypothetical protein